ncbi:FG-GAP-like repeat-containing protein [Streptomyces eurocidicus]|uniref:Deoxyribonuclease NucA/NucB domain-containing protein n=1 Tax=Streptomyces eurocidicus TaxID=66423 RepID=A0A7W8B9F9_STREU|nr:FG-GAP-like repeat-containing protein [Streptomyces eurocidicus]MBB5118722.1 hypothetical protein [Streptomyces eurocidicus]
MRKRPRLLAGAAAALCVLLMPSPAQAAEAPKTYKTVFSTVDGAGPDAKPVDPKELARSPRGKAGRPPEETPQEVEQRRRDALKKPQDSSPKRLAAAAGPPNPGRRDPAWCENRLKPGQLTMHETFDHWSFCDVQRYLLEQKECNGNTGKCKVIGTVNFRGIMAGEGHQGLLESDRKLSFTIKLDQPVFTGESERLKTQILTLSMRCWVMTGQGGNYCKQGARSGRSDLISRWLVDPYTWFDFDVPIGSATDADKLGHVDFRLIGNPGVGSPAEGDWTSRAGGARCDSNKYLTGYLSHGCVFDQTISVFNFLSRKETEHSAKHIREAQLYPDLTIPPVNNKSIPGAIESGKPLTRMRGGKENDYNRDKSTAQCRKWIAKKYHTMPNGPFDCDEYPFASTYEGSWMGNPDRSAMAHFSVKAIPSDDNQQGGRDLNDWYVEQRIIDEDRFYVKVVKQDGGQLVVPAPPLPPKMPQGLVTGDMDDDGKPDLLAVHGSGTGKLRFYPGKGDGNLGESKEIGSEGWAKAVFTHGQDFNGDEEEDVVARVGSELLLYPGKGDGTIGSSIPFRGYGTGWDTAVRSIVTLSDATGDGYPDVIALSKDELWLYPGDPSDKPSLLAPIKIGSRGWNNYDIIAVGDRTDEGKTDLVSRNRQSGMMFLYKGPLNRELKTPPALAEETAIRMVNGNSEKCLEIDGSSTRNGALAQQWDCKEQAGAK